MANRLIPSSAHKPTEGSVLRTWFAYNPYLRRPHIFIQGGFWRVCYMPPRLSDDSQRTIDRLWYLAHKWACDQNNKRKGFK